MSSKNGAQFLSVARQGTKTQNPSDFAQVQRQFATHLRNPSQPPPKGIEHRRLKIYQELIFKNVEGFISGAFPVMRSLFQEEAWHSLVRDFLVSYRCQTPYFLQISEEFLVYLQNSRVVSDCAPPFLLELAHYEWVELALDVAEDVDSSLLSLIALEESNWLDERIVLNPHLFCLSYQFPVHLIRSDFQPTVAPEHPTCLLVYRNNELRVKFSETTPIALSLLDLLQKNPELTGREALLQLAEVIHAENPARFVTQGAGLMAHLAELDVFWGTVKTV